MIIIFIIFLLFPYFVLISFLVTFVLAYPNTVLLVILYYYFPLLVLIFSARFLKDERFDLSQIDGRPKACIQVFEFLKIAPVCVTFFVGIPTLLVTICS